MAIPTLVIGALLIAVGLYGYFTGHGDAAHPVSPTALIPAGVGVALCVLGAVSFCDKLRKHAMHLAAMVGLLAMIGDGVQLVRTILNTETAPDVRQLKLISMAATFVLCLVFLVLCIRSFIQARKNRTTGQ
ncbi:MAG TPA: hypothetical protein VK737_11145 [Opitutales bacterium]|nr:hypothetical protein [Opitutales bacterium]